MQYTSKLLELLLGATKLCSLEKLFAELGWESLQERRNKHKLIILYKIINGLTPQYLQDTLPQLVHETTSYDLRNSNDIRNPRANTNLFFNSFLPSSIRAWNNLPEDTKNSPTVSSFKFRLNRNRYTPPKYFNVGSRKGQILHARLRMECSSLNSHLFRKNIVPSPSCICGGFESTYHFFKVQNAQGQEICFYHQTSLTLLRNTYYSAETTCQILKTNNYLYKFKTTF